MADRTTVSEVVKLRPNIYQVKPSVLGSNVYLIRGNNKNVLIDTGITIFFPQLKASLQELDLRPKDIHLIILTHEHFDHIGATTYFVDTALVAAHRLAANKIELQDEFVTWLEHCDASRRPFHAEVWLEDSSLIDLGNYKLRAIHTPGHTSGCICLYETKEKLLFTGDTLFSSGTLSSIASSGNISDYMNSLQRLSSLKVEELCPGHGRLSDDPEGDIVRALKHAHALFDETKIIFDTLSRKSARQVVAKRTLGHLSQDKADQ